MLLLLSILVGMAGQPSPYQTSYTQRAKQLVNTHRWATILGHVATPRAPPDPGDPTGGFYHDGSSHLDPRQVMPCPYTSTTRKQNRPLTQKNR